MLKQGISYPKIERELNCARSTIAYHAKHMGLTKKSGGERYDWGAIGRDIEENKLTALDCMKKYGMSKSILYITINLKSLPKLAKVAVTKAGAHAYRDRRLKKRSARRLWQIKINAALRERGETYSKFIGKLTKAKIEVDRKVLAEIAEKQPAAFTKFVDSLK